MQACSFYMIFMAVIQYFTGFISWGFRWLFCCPNKHFGVLFGDNLFEPFAMGVLHSGQKCISYKLKKFDIVRASEAQIFRYTTLEFIPARKDVDQRCSFHSEGTRCSSFSYRGSGSSIPTPPQSEDPEIDTTKLRNLQVVEIKLSMIDPSIYLTIRCSYFSGLKMESAYVFQYKYNM